MCATDKELGLLSAKNKNKEKNKQIKTPVQETATSLNLIFPIFFTVHFSIELI